MWAEAYGLDKVLHAGKEQGFTPDRWDSHRAGAFVANFVVIALIGPAVEELTFRGLGFSLLAKIGSVVAVVVVGLSFGLAHGLVNGLPILAIFGAVLALLRQRTGSVYPGIAVHGAFNAIQLITAVTMTHH